MCRAMFRTHTLAVLWRRWVLSFVLTAGVASVRAHDPGLSTADLHCDADVLQLIVGLAPADALQLLPASARPASASEARAVAPTAWDDAARAGCELTSGSTIVPPRDVRVRIAAADAIKFEYVFPRPAGPFKLRWMKLDQLPRGHRSFIIVSDENGVAAMKKFLTADAPAVEVESLAGHPKTAEGAEAPPTAFWGFLRLGIEHIWTGYDHLLFLFALLVVCRSFRSIFAIISCFTLAHSLTLALATLDVVNLSSRIVEPAIAASIVFVGVENLVRSGAEPRGRWALTFAFGLIHGFGFASVLRDLGVGSSGNGGVGMPLFTFNLGVEVGQIAVASVVLPLVWQLRKREKFVRWGVPILSAVVAAAGLYWFAMRTFFA